MNSPSSALVWELWRKNRWGVALLLLLLLSCGALRLWVAHLETNASNAQANFERLSQGTFSLDQVLPKSDLGPAATTGEIRISTIRYTGPLSPGDRLSWSGELSGGVTPLISIALNRTPLYEQKEPPMLISISAVGGSKRTISFAEIRQSGQDGTNATGRAQLWREAALAWSAVSMAFSLLAVFAIFGAAEPHPSRGFTGIPPRQFTLPVSTAELVGWPVGLGALVVMLTSLTWSKLVVAGLAPEGLKIPHLYLAAVMSAGLAVYQLLVWGLASFTRVRAASLTVLLLVIVGLAMLPFDGRSGSMPGWLPFESYSVAIAAVVWVGAVGTAWRGVSLERQGRWIGFTWSTVRSRTVSPPWPNRGSFGSPLQAQFWIEWRRNGQLPLMIWTVMVWFFLGSDLILRINSAPWHSDAIFGTGQVIAIAWIAVVGLNLARDANSKKLALSSFTAARPVATGALFEAKLWVGGMLWLGAVLVTAASFFLCSLSGGYLENIPDVSELVIILLVISLHIFVGIVPLCLSGRLPGFPWSLLPLVGVYGLVLNIFIWGERHSRFSEYLFWGLVALLILKLMTAFWAFRRALVLRISSAGFVARYAALWVVTAGFLVWLASRTDDRGSDGMVLIPAAALVVPLARIALSPLALALNRHR